MISVFIAVLFLAFAVRQLSAEIQLTEKREKTTTRKTISAAKDSKNLQLSQQIKTITSTFRSYLLSFVSTSRTWILQAIVTFFILRGFYRGKSWYFSKFISKLRVCSEKISTLNATLNAANLNRLKNSAPPLFKCQNSGEKLVNLWFSTSSMKPE